MNNYFYGWYFRCQGADGSMAVIPAVHLSETDEACSIQVITKRESYYRTFPIKEFRINREKGIMKIGENLFSRKGIRMKLEMDKISDEAKMKNDTDKKKSVMITGVLRFGEFRELKHDIMGPFDHIPHLECRHAVYSMRHTVNGKMKLGKETIQFQNGTGYMEGDSGTSFPERYIWTQHFLPEGSMMLAAATVPFAGSSFTGTIGFLCYGKRVYRFATYLGASVKKMEEKELMIRQGKYRLCVRFPEGAGNTLKAPDKGQMTRKVREEVSGRAEYTLIYRKRVLLHEVTNCAAIEFEKKQGFRKKLFYWH